MTKILRALSILCLTILLVGCSLGGGQGNVDPKYKAITQDEAYNIRQVITADSTTSRTIMWQSKNAEDEEIVEYRLQGTQDFLTQQVTREAFTDNKKTTQIYSALLSKLEPGKTYEYRVGFGNKRSPWLKLTTASGANFKAIIFPDSQSSDYNVWRATAEPAWKANKDANFFINMGDLVDNGEDDTQWDAWFRPVAGMIETIPVAPLMGNHETYNLAWKVRMPEAYLHLFNLPSVEPAKYHNQYYAFDYGDVHFTVLNTQFDELTQFQPDLLETELAWLKKDLASTTKKWKVVLMHKDVLQYSFKSRPEPRPEGISEIGKTFMPVFDQFKVDAVLTAHLHTYRRRGHIADFKRAVQGPLYIITGVAGNVRYPSLWKEHSLDEAVAPQPETDNYLTMEATEQTLKFSAFLPSGTEIDTVTLTK
jgi:hypothetical protein